jgi:hypothetical protein
MKCPLCQARSAKRHCPALDRLICSVCCGTKRGLEIRCPDTCGYLENAQSHPPALVRRQQERDVAILMPALTTLAEPEQQLLFLTLAVVGRHAEESLALDAAADADVSDALGALAGTFETASRGLIYEQRAASLPAQRIAADIRQLYDRIGAKQPTSFAASAARVLRRLEERVPEAHRAGLGERRGFLDLAVRVAGHLGVPPAEGGADAPRESGIILP